MSATLAPDHGPDATTASARPQRSPITIATRYVMPYVILIGCFLILVRISAVPFTNNDTYFHLRFGHEFLSTWSLRHPGSVTTYATADWVPTQWLPEVVMAKTEDWFGLAGVAWLSGFQLCTLALTFFLVARRQADAIVAASLTVVAIVASMSGLTMRPQVISYVLVSVTVACWLRARRNGTAPWILVPLTWAWAMCHGMWPVGIVISGAAVVGLVLDGDREAPRQRLLVPALSLVAAGLTPVGPELYRAVLVVNSRASYFAEWESPNFTDPNCLALLALLSLTVVVMLRRGRNPWFEVALVLVAGGFAVYSLRTVPVSAAILVPVTALVLQPLIGTRSQPRPAERKVVLTGYALALVVLAMAVPRTADHPSAQPNWLDPALESLPAGTPVLNEWNLGGYLIWRYPELDFTAHGYGDTFTTAELDRNQDMPLLKPGWETQVRRTGADYALLYAKSPLADALTHYQHWQVVHRSDNIVWLRRPTGSAPSSVG